MKRFFDFLQTFVLGFFVLLVMIVVLGLPVAAGFILYQGMVYNGFLLLKFVVGFAIIYVLGFLASKYISVF